jgi:hypothetical protein
MKLNEKNVCTFASSDSPVDKEGYLMRKSEVKGYQRRWYVLKGNLLFSYERKQDKDPAYLLVLESCSVQVSATEKHGFEISYDGPSSSRAYVFLADNDEEMQEWIRAVSQSSYEFLKAIVVDLQKQVDAITQRSQKSESPLVKKSTKVPIIPRPKQKVENGVLVDVVTVPPVPPKKRMVVVKSPEPDEDTFDYPINPGRPHSNPIVPPTVTTSRTKGALSPPGTLDRTPIMLPMTRDDYDVPPPTIPSEDDHTHPFVNLPSTHSSTVVHSMAAPITSHKDAYDIHHDFTDALNTLQSGYRPAPAGHSPSNNQ